MKTIYFFAFMMLSANVLAAKQLDCLYQHENKFEKVKREFALSPNRGEFSKSFRSHGFLVKVDEAGIHAEAFKGETKKVASQSLNAPWTDKRDPKEIDFAFEFKSAKSKISCR